MEKSKKPFIHTATGYKVGFSTKHPLNKETKPQPPKLKKKIHKNFCPKDNPRSKLFQKKILNKKQIFLFISYIYIYIYIDYTSYVYTYTLYIYIHT